MEGKPLEHCLALVGNQAEPLATGAQFELLLGQTFLVDTQQGPEAVAGASDAEYVMAPAPVVDGAWLAALVAVLGAAVVPWEGPVADMQAAAWPHHYFPLAHIN